MSGCVAASVEAAHRVRLGQRRRGGRSRVEQREPRGLEHPPGGLALDCPGTVVFVPRTQDVTRTEQLAAAKALELDLADEQPVEHQHAEPAVESRREVPRERLPAPRFDPQRRATSCWRAASSSSSGRAEQRGVLSTIRTTGRSGRAETRRGTASSRAAGGVALELVAGQSRRTASSAVRRRPWWGTTTAGGCATTIATLSCVGSGRETPIRRGQCPSHDGVGAGGGRSRSSWCTSCRAVAVRTRSGSAANRSAHAASGVRGRRRR